MIDSFFPKSIALAAKSTSDATWIGEILLALVNDGGVKHLDKGQQVVLAMCVGEIAERGERRKDLVETKRKSRAKGAAR